MALNFPNTPPNGQVWTDPNGQSWVYETTTNSWTAQGAVSGGMVYKGGIDITAAPPASQSGWTYGITTGGTPNAGFTGLSGTLTVGTQVTFDGTKWQQSGSSGPWTRTGTVLSPVNAGDVVNISAGTAALPGLTPVGDADTGIFFPAGDTIAFTEGGKEAARFDSGGRLLFGTTSAVAVNGITAGLELNSKATNNGASVSLARFAIDQPGPQLNFGKSRSGTLSPGGIVKDGDFLGEINFCGDDGTDLATPGGLIRCEVDGTPGANSISGRLVFATTGAAGAAPVERMRITKGGEIRVQNSVLVGTPTYMSPLTTANAGCQLNAYGIVASRSGQPCAQLQRTGSDGPVAYFYRQNKQVGAISVTATATAFNTSSDYRLKENVTPVSDGITRLQQLKPSRFNFIAEPGHTVDGFLAHEAQAVVPECVTGTKDAVDGDGNPDYQGIDQSKMVPLVVAALQEAIGEIESLKARLTAAGL